MQAFGKSINVLDDLFKNNLDNTQVLVDNVFADMYNEAFWKRYFDRDGMPTPTDTNGVAMFRSLELTGQSAPMLKPRARWSPPDEHTKGGFSWYSGSIGDFGDSFSITPQQREAYEKMLKQFNGNVTILKQYITSMDDLIKGANATISNLSAQLLSKGQMISVNAGFTFEGKADIPTTRFKTSGAKIWSDISSDILGKMQTEEADLRLATGFAGVLTWKMDKATFKNLQLNTAIRSQVGSYLNYNGVLFSTNSVVTLDAYNAWVSQNAGYYSIIELVEEKQMLNDGLTPFYRTVNGWETGNAVLSPSGKQGVIKYSDVEELAQMAAIPNRQIAYMNDGLFGIMNWIHGADRTPKWITELLIAIAPALSVFKTMTIVDTTTAD